MESGVDDERGRNDKEMGAEIFAEAETGTRYGFISRSSPKGRERVGAGGIAGKERRGKGEAVNGHLS